MIIEVKNIKTSLKNYENEPIDIEYDGDTFIIKFGDSTQNVLYIDYKNAEVIADAIIEMRRWFDSHAMATL